MSLVSKFLSPQQLEWSNTIGLTTALEDVLKGIHKGFYLPQDGSKMLNDLLTKALDDTQLISLTFDHFKNLIDEGDYLQVTGMMDYSQTGEASIFVNDYKVLAKSLRPLPEIMDYTNIESRYLDRVADFKMNTKDENGLAIRDIVRYKAKYWQIWREEMESEGFLEVECPVFESVPGGAEAKPFTTFYNELDQEMYLRISLELPLKKLVAGGFERVFEIGRIFRNEGSSPQHLQEYTQIEWYCAYTDYDWAAKFVKRVYQRVVEEILGKMNQVAYNGADINWGEWCSLSEAKKMNWELIATIKDGLAGWPKIPYFEAVRYFSGGGIDTENKTDEELLAMCKSNDINDVRIEDGRGTLMDKLWKKSRVNTTNPFFLVLPPVELEPLAKRDPSNPELTQRWQVVAGGAELGKAFSELNDPIDQFGRFEKQQEARDAGNEEAQFMDMNYVKAMEYGMPPMSGFGTSERVVSFLLGKHIRECVTFPHIRQEINNSKTIKESKIKYLQDQILKYSKELEALGVSNIQETEKKALENKTNSESEPEFTVETAIETITFDQINWHGGTILEYWQDSYRYESTAKVTDIIVNEIGTYIMLDKTIFYPQGGGQPSDTGKVFLNPNDYFVVTKCIKEEGIVKHFGYFENELNSDINCGNEVNLKVNSEARIQNIQLHSAAHLIDFAISELGLTWESDKGYSFPAGPYVQYYGEVDVTTELITKIEDKVNELRLQELDFVPMYSQDTKVKQSGVEVSRKIVIQGQDNTYFKTLQCGCGGTHINNTRELNSIKIRKIQSKKGTIKVAYEMGE